MCHAKPKDKHSSDEIRRSFLETGSQWGRHPSIGWFAHWLSIPGHERLVGPIPAWFVRVIAETIAAHIAPANTTPQ